MIDPAVVRVASLSWSNVTAIAFTGAFSASRSATGSAVINMSRQVGSVPGGTSGRGRRRPGSGQIRAMTSARLAAYSSSVSKPSSRRLASLRRTLATSSCGGEAGVSGPVRRLNLTAST